MKIDAIELYHVSMPLVSPWRTAYGEDASVSGVLCRMWSGSTAGWGEACPLEAPCYSPEWAGGVFAVVRDWMAPRIVGQSFQSAEQLQERLSIFKGNLFAKAVLESAWWSLSSKISAVPLHRLLGATRSEVPVGADFGVMDSIDELLAAVARAVADGFPRIKLKFRPGWDIPMLEAVRRQHPGHTLHIDCNGAYGLDDLDLLRRIDEFQLAMIEQPLAHDDLVDHARLQSQITTPLCLDESVTTPRKAQQAIELGSCRFINVKPGRVGGLASAVAIHNICRDAGIGSWVGGMLESSTGAAQCAALAMLDHFTYAADIFPSSRFYAEDLSDPPLELHRSTDGVPCVRALDKLPEPVPARLEKWTVQSCVVG